ncbi:hypothetical protein [Williamsoniiplasma lucivorax]|uniref:Uncharacterized protein n=1 Tax=Williamsoniiplasma lucivorax TaxID=209274 RepID=A0A2S5RFD9_9MOLU|nr:hypothetical protein [Williamsoniiplasma lucivorax]PPE06008.1 hypothetical protein ELUCI_v1c02990 [Williamsoniiplasma lucivorax]
MKTKFEGQYKTGLTLIIIGASIVIGVISIMILVFLAGVGMVLPFWPTRMVAIPIIFMVVFLVPTIVTLVLAIIEMKNKTAKRKIVLAILGIIFSTVLGVIGGIFLLIAEQEPISVSQTSSQPEQIL